MVSVIASKENKFQQKLEVVIDFKRGYLHSPS